MTDIPEKEKIVTFYENKINVASTETNIWRFSVL